MLNLKSTKTRHLHRDTIDWEAFFPQKTEEEETRLNNLAKETDRCRGCKISHNTPKTQKLRMRIWCHRCSHTRFTVSKNFGYDREKWISMYNRLCKYCKSKRNIYPLSKLSLHCSEECRVSDRKRIQKQWVEDNLERYKERKSKRYQKNRFIVSIKNRNWVRNNPEKVREIRRRSDQKHRNKRRQKRLIRDLVRNDKISLMLYERQKGLCGLTNLPMDLKIDNIHIDHIIPLERGGTNHHMNLQLTHGVANCKKQDSLECEISSEDWRAFYIRSLEEMIKIREEMDLPTEHLIKFKPKLK